MKKILISAIFLLTFQLFAVDFKTEKKSELFVSSGTKRVYSNDIYEGEKLQSNDTTIFYRISNWDYALKVVYHYGNYFTNLENLIPFQDGDLFSENILTSEKNKQHKKWISKTYFDLMEEKCRENIKTIQPCGYSNYERTKTEYDENYLERICHVQTQEIFNVLINIKDIFNSCSLYIERIEKTIDGYIVSTKVSDWYMHDSLVKYDKDDSLVLNLIFDGDYLYLKYTNDEILTSFVLINEDTFNEITKFMKTNVYDKKSITWPRHADGSCDYEDNSKSTLKVKQEVKRTPKILAPASAHSKAESSKLSASATNVSKNKIMTVNENLKLRAGEATTTSVLTVMQAGTKVKILELGKAETIDGINSNWVKVEVQGGAKDRDGKEIKKGTVGWCYGGYLK